MKKGKKETCNTPDIVNTKPFLLVGMTANAASATSAARVFSEPNCFGVRADLKARPGVGSVSGVGRTVVDRSVCNHVLTLVIVLEERRYSARRKDRRKGKRKRRIRVE